MEHVLPGDPPVAVALRRSGRARRLSLRVSRLDGRATLTLPPRARLRDGIAFLAEREAWLREHLRAAPAAIRPVLGGTIPFEGGTLALLPALGGSARIEDGALLVPEGAERLEARVGAVLKAAARDRLVAACDRHAAALGRPSRRLTLRDPRSRWGSCGAGGDLMFSWRLVLAPPVVLDYVAVHEVAHLARLDHSPAFWAVVARLLPGFEAPRAWLREHGASLHRLRLDGGDGRGQNGLAPRA